MSILYRLLLWLALPALLLRLEWRARREPEYGERIGERLGRVPGGVPAGCVWIHAVSAGETIAAAPFIAELVGEFSGAGGVPFLVTSMTPTGSVQVRARLGDAVHHCYAPYDFPFAVRSFFDRVRPRLLVLVETELWPNTIAEGHRRGVPVVLVNARLSERSARGYRRLGGLTRQMLRRLDTLACQTDVHLRRFANLGLANDTGTVIGSVKYDAKLTNDHAQRVAALRRDLRLSGRRVWIAGSTHSGEDEAVLAAHALVRNQFPDAALLLVPRHAVRATQLCAMARRNGHTAHLAGAPTQPRGRHQHPPADAGAFGSRDVSGNPPPAEASRRHGRAPIREPEDSRPIAGGVGELGDRVEAGASVIVWNTLGQLQTLYGLAQFAFLGGSLVPVGGHNPIEAALCGQPLAMGPHTWNFDEIAKAFEAAGCLNRVQTASQLADAVVAAFTDEPARIATGARARRVVEENGGASERLLELLRARIRTAIA